MIETTKPTDGRGLPRTTAGLLPVLVLVATLLVGGCGGGASIEGYWEGVATIPDERDVPFTLDLEKGDADDLRGTITVTDSGGDESTGAVAGTVDSDGAFRLELDGGMTMDGQVEASSMTGQWLNESEAYSFNAERISEDEAANRAAERERTREMAERRAEEEAQELAQVTSRYEDLQSEVGNRMNGVQRRVSTLRDAAGQGPGEQLQDTLGPEDPGGDLYACSMGGASCEVADLEQRLESDAEDMAEGSCETADLGYYADYSYSDQSGYPEERNAIAEASDGLAEDANEMEAKAQEMELVKREIRQMGGNASGSVSAGDAAILAEDARQLANEAETALAAADERYAGYEERAQAAKDEAAQLAASAGCGSGAGS